MANEAEQTQDVDGIPGLWLARVSQLGNALRENRAVLPAVFHSCATTISLDNEVEARAEYLAALNLLSFDISNAMATWNGALRDVVLALPSQSCGRALIALKRDTT